MTEKVFTSAMALLQAQFGKVEPVKYRIYWDMMKHDFEDAEFMTSVGKLLKTFIPTSTVPFPTIAHFQQTIGRDENTKAQRIMAEIVSAIHSAGAYRSVDFGRAVNSVISRYGGWVNLCGWTQKDWSINEGRFMESIKSALAWGADGPDYCGGIVARESTDGRIELFRSRVALELTGDTVRDRIESVNKFNVLDYIKPKRME